MAKSKDMFLGQNQGVRPESRTLAPVQDVHVLDLGAPEIFPRTESEELPARIPPQHDFCP